MSKAICLLARSLRTTSALELVVRSCAYKRACIPFVPMIARAYTTQKSLKGTSTSQREKITIASDDGHVAWGELSIKEKAARTTQQSFNFMIIVAGIVMTGGVIYLFYSDVLSTDSKTSHYGRALEQIKKDPRCVEMLGDSKKLKAHGGATSSRWSRNIIPPYVSG
ncbi:MAG: hypothetical protein M1835_000247 [Candelina submexicana]|nr:MAG: hypothetical protein M1835_000247 [Candelina submexicana]